MKDNLTIQLTNLRFFAYHGLHEEERLTGGDFNINLWLSYSPAGMINEISQTIDYVRVYDIVKQQMKVPEGLLESLSINLVEILKKSFPQITIAEIEITKLYPPILSFIGSVGVRYRKEFK